MVNKIVEMMVDKMWMKSVKKRQMWNKKMHNCGIFSQNWFFARSFEIILYKIYTLNLMFSYLLNQSFPRFTHRTINTTTLLNNKKNF